MDDWIYKSDSNLLNVVRLAKLDLLESHQDRISDKCHFLEFHPWKLPKTWTRIKLGLVFALLVFIVGCEQPNKLVESLDSAKFKVQTLDLSSDVVKVQQFFDPVVSKICLQWPYGQQKYFEREVGHKVNSYEMVFEEKYVLWIFFSDKTIKPRQFSLPSHKFNARRNAVFCSSSALIYFEREPDQLVVFFFKE
jgi:hypothetical protein